MQTNFNALVDLQQNSSLPEKVQQLKQKKLHVNVNNKLLHHQRTI